MTAVTDVTIASGVPTVGTGTVATLSKFEKAASTGGPAASDVALAVTIRDVNANGQATMANSTPVVMASDQSNIPTNIKQVNGSSLALGQTTMSASLPVAIASDQGGIPVTSTGNVASGSADSGNPVKQGFKATTSLSGLTLAADANRTDGRAGVDGVQLVRMHTNLEDIVSGVLANTDGASTSVIAAQGAGIKIYITTAILANTSATAVTVDLRDGAAGSVKATLPVPANTSGAICNLPVPLPFSANTAVCMDGSAAASTVTCTLIGFKSKI